MNLSEKDMGKWFSVPWSPSPHKMVRFQPLHCALHGEFCWNQAGLIKRRNSEKRPWGGAVHMVRADQNEVKPWTGEAPAEPSQREQDT